MRRFPRRFPAFCIRHAWWCPDADAGGLHESEPDVLIFSCLPALPALPALLSCQCCITAHCLYCCANLLMHVHCSVKEKLMYVADHSSHCNALQTQNRLQLLIIHPAVADLTVHQLLGWNIWQSSTRPVFLYWVDWEVFILSPTNIKWEGNLSEIFECIVLISWSCHLKTVRLRFNCMFLVDAGREHTGQSLNIVSGHPLWNIKMMKTMRSRRGQSLYIESGHSLRPVTLNSSLALPTNRNKTLSSQERDGSHCVVHLLRLHPLLHPLYVLF